ncbi:MAG TPA: vitamin B12 dependent-methionine synthase activation domain-containing protein [Draconibacterium sp.]|nr:vitamin B12 dependent-methionine synthase activation domain-containing protein [Draconibacterium sp.]
MIKEFRYSFEDLGVEKNDLAVLMGFEEEAIPEPFPKLIEQALNHAPSICNIRGGYKVFESNGLNTAKQTIKIGKYNFNPSKIVTTQFKNASSFALFICTAGSEISEYTKKLSSKGDPLLGYVFDVVGSVTVEKATDKIQKSLEEECQQAGLGISDRFSPGYCEWSVSEQQMLFALMPENFCGVTLSESSLMSPIKSVSGIVAIGNGLSQKGYQCHWCSEKNCIYGKIKRQKKI